MDQLLKQRSQALTALLVLTLIWGYNWVVMKSALQYAGPFQFAAMRTFFGALVLFLVLYVTRRPMGLTEFPTMLLLGILQNVGFTGVLMWALVQGGAGKTAVLTYTMPFWTLLFAWPMLGERIHGWQWLAVISAVLGMLFIFDPLHLRADSFSMLLAVLSGVSWAVSAIMTKQLHRRHPTLDLINLTAWPMLLGSLPMVLIAFLVPAPTMQWSGYLIGAVLFNVVLCGALAWLLWLFALQRLPAGVASMASMLAPVIGVIAAWIQLHEVPDGMEMIGMALILFSLSLISILMMRPAYHGIPPASANV
ncbi:EamA family transporter [Methylophilus sp. YYY-1]|jgi:drug/metabolite transporter (DMT)-like permease|uniref:DMT family transporter n=1 Tax=Methylophilus sp. YYY-1 TaxID=2682087 RepID=UPI0023B2DEF3|nr:EamA family transporter [Methylophilus sp. YYY-1]MDF0378000.1 EamA family transporter [Methylophilus sp. YYY-1]